MSEIGINGASQNEIAKSNKAHLAAQIARLVRKEGLDYCFASVESGKSLRAG